MEESFSESVVSQILEGDLIKGYKSSLCDKSNDKSNDIDSPVRERIKSLKNSPHKNYSVLDYALTKHKVFSYLNHEDVNNLIRNLEFCMLLKGSQFLFEQGDSPGSFFIIHKGEIIIEKDGVEKRRMGEGEGFGEVSMICNQARSASAKVGKPDQELQLWMVPKKIFKDIVREFKIRNKEEDFQLLQSIPLFSNFFFLFF